MYKKNLFINMLYMFDFELTDLCFFLTAHIHASSPINYTV